MRDDDCVRFLQWALPRLGLRWRGFRKVRRQVCRRLQRRIEALGLADVDTYRTRLEHDASEWMVLDGMCHITISRFCRDRAVFQVLLTDILPGLARTSQRERRPVACWSAGCASGEEPYTMAILWYRHVAPVFPDASIRILATDIDENVLDRARAARYQRGSLRELDDRSIDWAFERCDGDFVLRDDLRSDVSIVRHDVRDPTPDGPFDLIACRNLAFTYFEREQQERVLDGLIGALRRGGFLVLGGHETLPSERDELRQLESLPIWRHA